MLHVEVEGAAELPAVVFLHGFMGAGSDWAEVVAGMRGHARCVIVDLPGHGASTGLPAGVYEMDGAARALSGALHVLGVDRCTLVGYSMGGRLALYAALREPARCRRLVLESASPGLRTEAERAARRQSDEALAVRLETEPLERFVDDWYRQPLFESLAARPERAAALRAARRRNDPHELARALRGLGTGRQPPLWEALEGLDVPVLAVAGALDGKYVEIAQRMALANPRVRTALLPNTGHNVHAEVPGTFADVLLGFLQQT